MRLYFLALCGLCLTGCASDPPAPPPPTIVNIAIHCGPELNPGGDGLASPVLLRLYELRSPASFNAADFFALFNDDSAVLGGDLAHKSVFQLKPGEFKQLMLQPEDDSQAIGLFAAFRQLDNAQWRIVRELIPHRTQSWIIHLNQNQLQLGQPQ